MSGAQVQLKHLDKTQKRLRRLERHLGDPAPYLRSVTPHYVSAVKANFTAGGQPRKWQRKADGKASHLMSGGGGGLRSSINGRVEGDVIKIGAGKKYAAIHQFGGTIGPIVPRRAKALRFVSNGKVVFTKRVEQVVIPARPFLVIPPKERMIGLQLLERAIKKDFDK